MAEACSNSTDLGVHCFSNTTCSKKEHVLGVLQADVVLVEDTHALCCSHLHHDTLRFLAFELHNNIAFHGLL